MRNAHIFVVALIRLIRLVQQNPSEQGVTTQEMQR